MRLRPLTDTMPKPLLTVQGRPLITHIFDQLIDLGVQRIIVNTHHCAQRYAEFFPDQSYRAIPLHFQYEPHLLETGGGIKNIESLVDPHSPLLIYNGDVFSTLSLRGLVDFHGRTLGEVTLALRSQGQPLNVQLAQDGTVLDFRHTFKIATGRGCLFTGIYIVDPHFFTRLVPDQKESVIETFLKMIAQGHPPRGILLDEGTWSDIGTLKEYEKLNTL